MYLKAGELKGNLVEIKETLNNKKKLYRSINLSKLPDGGAKIKKQIDDLELELEKMSVKEEKSHDDCLLPNSESQTKDNKVKTDVGKSPHQSVESHSKHEGTVPLQQNREMRGNTTTEKRADIYKNKASFTVYRDSVSQVNNNKVKVDVGKSQQDHDLGKSTNFNKETEIKAQNANSNTIRVYSGCNSSDSSSNLKTQHSSSKDFFDSTNSSPSTDVSHTSEFSSEAKELGEALRNKKKLYHSLKLSNLPDGGLKIKKQIDDLEFALEQLSIRKEIENEQISDKNTPPNIFSTNSHAEKSQIKSDPAFEKSQSSKIESDLRKNITEEAEAKDRMLKECSSNSKSMENSLSYLSFKDLKPEHDGSGDSLNSNSFPKTPSFTSYRSRDNNQKPTTKLTEAKNLPPHLIAKKLNLKYSQSIGSYSHESTSLGQAKTVAVENIHNSLKSCPLENEESPTPEGLKTALMKHQKRALSWLAWRETQKPCGGIFADDMGLGKTLTMIALIMKDKEYDSKKQNKCTLVVCLASIIHQWKNEIVRHCKEKALQVLIYHGQKRTIDSEEMIKYDVIITTYNLVLSEGKKMREKKSSPLFGIKWRRIILDEAHSIKNHKSQTAENVFKLDSELKWAVTGTPIHNDLKDVFSLLKFLKCEPFDDFNIWKKLINDFSERSITRRNALIKSILLRRCKDQTDETGSPMVQLPNKSTIIHKITLESTERAIYDDVYSTFKTKVGQLLIQSPSKKLSTSGDTYLTLLLKLQQCCNHPSLMKASIKDDETLNDSDSVSDILDNFSALSIGTKVTESSCSGDSFSKLDISFNPGDIAFDKNERSAKIRKLLKKVLKIKKKNEKIVIVSRWVAMLDIVALHLDKADIQYHTIKGSTKPEERNNISEDFNSNLDGISVLLLSLKAGGVGLNLIGGNHMFILDLHWNPALETQASDRIYRVGQERDVYIHKFVCANTIEEKIIRLQEEKKHLAASVLDGAKSVSQYLTMDDLKMLFDH